MNREPSATHSSSGEALGVSLQRVLNSFAAGRCYACGWPLGSCKPFNCAMRFKDGTESLADQERWHERQAEMSEVFVCFTSASSPYTVSETGINFLNDVIEECASVSMCANNCDQQECPFCSIAREIRAVKASYAERASKLTGAGKPEKIYQGVYETTVQSPATRSATLTKESETCPECKCGNRLNGRIVHGPRCSIGEAELAGRQAAHEAFGNFGELLQREKDKRSGTPSATLRNQHPLADAIEEFQSARRNLAWNSSLMVAAANNLDLAFKEYLEGGKQ